MTTKRTFIAAAALLIALPAIAAQREDREPRARVHAGAGRAERALGLVRIPVEIDVTSVHAVLGAYVAKVSFDPAALTFVGAAGGAAPEFHADPAATNAKKANEEGVVRIAAAQTSTYGPTGKVSVAVLTFREIVAGGTQSLKVVVESAATAESHALPVDTN
jgi:hypothetical protein